MTTALVQVQPFVYTNPKGLKLEVLFVLSPEKKGYINATAIAKQFGREPIHWLRNNQVQEYIMELLRSMNQNRSANSQSDLKSITYDDLVIIINGGPIGTYGTWLHPRLAVIFARWLSPHFAVWCDDRIAGLLHQQSRHQLQFPDLSLMFDQIFEQFDNIKISQRQMEQRFEERFDTTEKILNRFHTQLAQDSKNTLGPIYLNLNHIHKMLYQQQQADLLQPPVQESTKQTLLDYQQVVEQMLRPSAKGKWYGSSVKRYVESHHQQ